MCLYISHKLLRPIINELHFYETISSPSFYKTDTNLNEEISKKEAKVESIKASQILLYKMKSSL